MAFVSETHTATTARSQLVWPAKQDHTDGRNVEINNVGPETVYVGGDDLTDSSGGTAIPAGQQWWAADLTPIDQIYVITASGSSTLSILWTGV